MSYVAYQQSPHQARNKLLRWAFFGFLLVLISAGTWTALNAFRDLQNLRAQHPQTKRVQEALSNDKTASLYQDLIPEETTPESTGTSPLSFLIAQYANAAELPEAPEAKSAYIYTFKADLSQHDTEKMARTLIGGDLTTEYSHNGQVVTYSSTTGILAVNTQNGAFTFQSLTRKVPFSFNSSSPDVKDELTAYLFNNGLIDDTVETTAYYTRSTAPGVTFYELHRSWDTVGYPIVNPIASAGLPESITLEELSLAKTYKDAPRDVTIISASDAPGRARNTDFNTMTVGIADDGTLVSIDSNIRPIESKESLADREIDLLDPQDVISELEAGGGYFSMALPAGEGVIDPEKLFKNGIFQAQNAEITDISLTYIEKQPEIEQKYMIPAYLVRGTAETDTGIRTTFAQTVPAVGDEVSLVQTSSFISKLASAISSLTDIGAYAQDFRERYLIRESTIVKTSNIQPTPAQNEQNCRREIIYPCGDGEINIKCTFTINTCPTPTSAPPTPEITNIPEITDQPEVTPQPPTNTPIPDEPGEVEPCVLYKPISGGEFEIIEYGHLAENTGSSRQGSSYYHPGSYTISGAGTLTYFPINMPEGPVAYLKYPELEPGLPYIEVSYGFGNVPYGESNRVLQEDIEVEAAQRAIRRIQEDPSLYVFIQHPRHPLPVLDLNKIFPEVTYDLNDNRIINSTGISWIIRQVMEGYNGWSVEKLLSIDSPIPDLPTEILIGSRRATFGYNTIAASIGDLVLDKRCKFQSPISPTIYVYPQNQTALTLTFNHDHAVYVDPELESSISFTADPDGKLTFSTGDIRDKIYYEYSGVTLPTPSTGWNINSEELLAFVDSLAGEMGLTHKETSDLLQDVSASLVRKELGERTFVGIVDEGSVHKELPFTLSDSTEVQRIHIYIGSPVKGAEEPNYLPFVKRTTELTVLELGVYVE